MKNTLLISYVLLLLIFSVFSFVLADPNLFLLKADIFVSFQTYLWKNVLPLQNLRTIFYGVLIIALFVNYLLILKNWQKFNLNHKKNFWQFFIIVSLPLIVSYNALSYDLFNYIFNAKMVVEFGANPHLQTAMDFPDEPMLRFMNNIHTPAPYGYGWTGLSILPYLLGMNKFFSTFLAFKLFAFISLVLTLLIMEKLANKTDYKKLAMLYLNPLLLIEVLSSAHNDLWMLAPALLAIYLVTNLEKQKLLKTFFIIILMTLSISIKYATIALLPFFFYFFWQKKLDKIIRLPINAYIFDLMSLALFLPLLTERSRYFLPWYLIWSLVFIPLLKSNFLKNLLLVFSFSSLLRYLPWFYYLPWMSFHLNTSWLVPLQKIITWTIPGFYLLLNGVVFLFNRKRVT